MYLWHTLPTFPDFKYQEIRMLFYFLLGLLYSIWSMGNSTNRIIIDVEFNQAVTFLLS